MADDQGDGERRACIADGGGHVLAHDLLVLGVESEGTKEDDEEVERRLGDHEEHDGDAQRGEIVAVKALRDDQAGGRVMSARGHAGSNVSPRDLPRQARAEQHPDAQPP